MDSTGITSVTEPAVTGLDEAEEVTAGVVPESKLDSGLSTVAKAVRDVNETLAVHAAWTEERFEAVDERLMDLARVLQQVLTTIRLDQAKFTETITAAEDPFTPLIDVCVDLAPGMIIQMDRCFGDLPVLEVIDGPARLTFRANKGDVSEVDEDDLALAERFAAGACALRDEIRQIVELRGSGSTEDSSAVT